MQSIQLRIGTRGSELALWQATAVKDALISHDGLGNLRIDIDIIKTSGDRIQDRALLEAGGKGLFTKEIEERLLEGKIDLAVHSAKDLQTRIPDGLTIAGYLKRADVRDVLVGPGLHSVDDIPRNAAVGTASLRRQALIRRLRSDVETVLLRGNVPTRIKKVEAGECAATILAKAGLDRLGLSQKAAAILPLDSFPPACGQGAVAIECRSDDTQTQELLATISDSVTGRAVSCERAFLAALDGSCRAPIAGHARVQENEIRFSGAVLSPDGREIHAVERVGNVVDSEALGDDAGAEIRRNAAPEFLASIGIAP